MKMKKTLLLISLLSLAVLPGCREAETDIDIPAPSGKAVRTARVRVGFAEAPGTKSQVTVDVEDFTEAYLFAFWASGDAAGEPCMVDGRPVAVYTDSRIFDWELPVGVPIEVMAMVNAVEDVRREIDRWAHGLESYTRDELLSFTYTCSSASDLVDLQYREYNMPMTGTVTVTLDEGNPVLTVPVKRLFAKFNITLDVSPWAEEGWTVTAARVSGARSNTEVPYFYTGEGPGFRQTDPAKFAAVDGSTAADLNELNFRDAQGRSRAVTYYFLENCQGVAGTASRWNRVAMELGDEVSNCSYLMVYVRASRPGSGTRAFAYRIYLDSTEGSAMNTSFNIVRNSFRSIILRLGAPQDGFQWTDVNTVSAAQGDLVTLLYETSLPEEDIVFSPEAAGLSFVSLTHLDGNLSREPGTGSGERRTDYPYYGSVRLRANAGAADGRYRVTGGNADGTLSDETAVILAAPVHLSSTVATTHYAFQRFAITIHSESMASWSDERKARMEAFFGDLTLRCNSADARIMATNPVYRTSVSGTDDVLNKTFVVLSTRSGVSEFQPYNPTTDIGYSRIYVGIQQPTVKFITQKTGSYSDNAYAYTDTEGDDGPVYSTPITGEDARGYFQLCNQFGNPIIYESEDLALGSLALTPVMGFPMTVSRTAFSSGTFVFRTYLADWATLEGNGWGPNTDGSTCELDSVVYNSTLELRSESGSLVCAEPVHLEVTNPFHEWFPDGDYRPFSYDVILDGTTDYIQSEDFSRDWPYTASIQPEVLSHGNVNTSKGSYSPYSLVWEYHSNEVECVRVANDLRNNGCLEIGGTVTHTRTGDTVRMLWGRVNVIREYVIYAGYQFSQVAYLTTASTPANAGNLSRFIPYIYVRDRTGMPVTLRNCVRTTATASTGINAVNPSEEYYRATCAAEHWWPEHAGKTGYDSTNSTLWDCEYAEDERDYLLQNRVVVYSSPKTVTSKGELSYYELQYAGPVVDSHLNFFLGHHGHHADNIYSFRSVAYWNAPAFEFHTANINPMNRPEIRTFPGGEKYLAIGDYTRVRFFWRMRKATISPINAYDTRYALDVTQTFQTTYSNAGDPTYYMYYFGDAILRTTYQTTSYYDPRRNVRERMKLFTPTIPFYRVKGTAVHAAFDGAVTGSYKEENIASSHKFGDAYGTTDSFWLPENQIP